MLRRKRQKIQLKTKSLLIFTSIMSIGVFARIIWLEINVHTDEGIAGYVARLWLYGILPFSPKSVPDNKGLFFYFLYLLATLSDNPIFYIRIINLLFYFVLLIALFLLVRNWYGESIGFLSLLFLIFSANAVALEGVFPLGMTISLPFIVLSIYFCNIYVEKAQRIYLILSGIMLAIIFLIRQDVFIHILILGYMLLVKEKRRFLKNLSILLSGIFLPISIVLVYYLYNFAIIYLVEGHIKLITDILMKSIKWTHHLPITWSITTLIEVSPLYFFTILGILMNIVGRLKYNKRQKSINKILYFWLLLSFYRSIMLGSFLGHSLLPTILPCSIISAISLNSILSNNKILHKILNSFMIFVFFAPFIYIQSLHYPSMEIELGFLSWPTSPLPHESMMLAKYLKERAKDNETLVHSYWPEIYWLAGFKAPAHPYLDTINLGLPGSVTEEPYLKLVEEVKEGKFRYVVLTKIAPEDDLARAVKIPHKLTNNSIVKYNLIIVTEHYEVYERTLLVNF